MAQGVVVANLPQHAAVGADGGDDGDAADDGKSSDTVEQVGGENKLAKLARRRSDKECVVLASDHSWPLRPNMPDLV